MKRQLLTLALLASVSTSLWAADCSVQIEANDSMQFNKSKIVVPSSCDEFTVELKHTGSLNRSVMGHNWVLSTESDERGVLADGASAGLDNGYTKEGDDRIIAQTALIGGGESDSVTFSTKDLKSGGDYVFFCSFPGHESLMRGDLVVE